MTMRCPIEGTWTAGWLPFGGLTADPKPRDVPVESLSASVASWRVPRPSEAPDDESLMCFAAWSEGKLPLFLRARNVEWPSQIAVLLDHARPPVGVFNVVEPDGMAFTLRGWADPAHYAELQARPFLSPRIRNQVIQFASFGAKQYGDCQSAWIVEMSATANPNMDGTSFRVGIPARVPEGEFYELDPAAEMFTFVATI